MQIYRTIIHKIVGFCIWLDPSYILTEGKQNQYKMEE